MRLSNRPLAYVDVETTGLEAHRHEIVEIAIVYDVSVLHDAEEPLWTRYLTLTGDHAVYRTRIRPTRLEDADPVALGLNGYAAHPELWSTAPTFPQVAHVIKEMLGSSILVGHNVPFDRAFIESEMRRAGIPMLFHHTIDTVALAHEHLVPCGLDALNLDRVCEMLGITSHHHHRALADARRCRAVYKRLSRASTVDRTWWWLRDRFRKVRGHRRGA